MNPLPRLGRRSCGRRARFSDRVGFPWGSSLARALASLRARWGGSAATARGGRRLAPWRCAVAPRRHRTPPRLSMQLPTRRASFPLPWAALSTARWRFRSRRRSPCSRSGAVACCFAYIETGNARQAVVEAGYNVKSPKTATEVGREILASVAVQHAYQALLEARGLSGAKLDQIHAVHLARHSSPDAGDRDRSLRAAELRRAGFSL